MRGQGPGGQGGRCTHVFAVSPSITLVRFSRFPAAYDKMGSVCKKKQSPVDRSVVWSGVGVLPRAKIGAQGPVRWPRRLGVEYSLS